VHLRVVETGSRGRAAVGDRVAPFTLDRGGVTVSRAELTRSGRALPFGVDELIYRFEHIVVAVMSAANRERS
jgi:hypothetical protein